MHNCYETIYSNCVNRFSYPIAPALAIYAEQKVRLRRLGRPVDAFDIPIGSTALMHSLTLVTHNTKHFANMANLVLENWVAPA